MNVKKLFWDTCTFLLTHCGSCNFVQNKDFKSVCRSIAWPGIDLPLAGFLGGLTKLELGNPWNKMKWTGFSSLIQHNTSQYIHRNGWLVHCLATEQIITGQNRISSIFQKLKFSLTRTFNLSQFVNFWLQLVFIMTEIRSHHMNHYYSSIIQTKTNFNSEKICNTEDQTKGKTF